MFYSIMSAAASVAALEELRASRPIDYDEPDYRRAKGGSFKQKQRKQRKGKKT